MARESYVESQILTPAQRTQYLDQREVIRGVGKHMTEHFMGQVTGAGGAGGSVLAVPFQPAIIRVINAAGATPAVWESFFPDGGTARHVVTTTAVAANATPPTRTQVGPNNWTIGLPTQIAPNGEVVIVECIGFKPVGGSL